MANSRSRLIDVATRHAIFVQRFSGAQAREALKYVNRVKQETLSLLSQGELSTFSKKRLDELYRSLDATSEQLYLRMGQNIGTNVRPFASYEAQFSTRMIGDAVGTDLASPTAQLVQAAVFSRPLKLRVSQESGTIEDALRQFSKEKRQQMSRVIRDGVIAGKTNALIRDEVERVANSINRNHATALVRTVTNYVSNTAREIVIEQNDDILEGYEWVSTLDDRTTETCMALDGQIFPVNSGPRPPLHWGCRSTIIPVVKKEYRIAGATGDRPAVVDGDAEQVSASTNYGEWLRSQPAKFQDEVLGQKRGALFREGGLSLTKFVDENYAPLTLDELKAKEPLAFEKSGIN